MLIAKAEISLEALQGNVMYKAWESMKWNAGEEEQRARHREGEVVLAFPPPPSVKLSVVRVELPPLKQGEKLQRALECRLPMIAHFTDPHF